MSPELSAQSETFKNVIGAALKPEPLVRRAELLIVVCQPVHLCSPRLTQGLLAASRCLQAEPSGNLIRDPDIVEREGERERGNLCCINVRFFDVLAPAFKFKQRAAINLSNTQTNSNYFLLALKKSLLCQKKGQRI